MRRFAVIVTLAALTACSKDDGSNLEKMAAKQTVGAEAANDAAADPGPGEAGENEAGEPAPTTPKSGLLSPGEGEKVELRFALPEGTTYAVTTIGLLTLPAVQKPIGFARREEITVGNCDGEGYTRACDLTQRITNYEAEQPEGRPLEIGEEPVLKLTTKHRMDATGRREGKTTVEGEGADDPQARALEEAHRFFCLRLPAEPVGVGAVWADTCKMRTGGQVVTKEAKWELKKLDDDPEGAGRRAEIHMQAKYTATDSEGNPRNGVSRGILYLWADAGEPHLYKEAIAVPLGSTGFKTKTALNYQFAKVDPKDPEKIVRTDGQEFPGFRTLNDIRSEEGAGEPAGDQ